MHPMSVPANSTLPAVKTHKKKSSATNEEEEEEENNSIQGVLVGPQSCQPTVPCPLWKQTKKLSARKKKKSRIQTTCNLKDSQMA